MIIRLLLLAFATAGLWSASDSSEPAPLPSIHTGDGIDLVLIPSGSCIITHGDSQETLAVSQPFFLARHEVSQGLWRALMQEDPSWMQGDDLPVEWVSWEDCQEFLRRLSLRDGRTYRLPSQTEWEYACRTGSSESLGDGAQTTYLHTRELTPIAACPANAWGLRGMNGNVWEWCSDLLPEGKHAMRGGSCNLYPVWCPPEDSLAYPANFKHERRGLRLASDLLPTDLPTP